MEPDRNVSTAKLFLSFTSPHEDVLQPNHPGGLETFISFLPETTSIKENMVRRSPAGTHRVTLA